MLMVVLLPELLAPGRGHLDLVWAEVEEADAGEVDPVDDGDGLVLQGAGTQGDDTPELGVPGVQGHGMGKPVVQLFMSLGLLYWKIVCISIRKDRKLYIWNNPEDKEMSWWKYIAQTIEPVKHS